MATRNEPSLSLTGQALRGFIAEAERDLPSARRDAAAPVMEHLFGAGRLPGRIMALHGLRGSGKTTLMLQCIADALRAGHPAKRIAFLDFSEARPSRGTGVDLWCLASAMSKLRESGADVFLVDGVRFKDLYHASDLAILFGRRGRVLLSGDDSLAFLFAGRTELFDQLDLVHMTHIPYAEHERLVPGTTIDGHIENGGLFIGRRKGAAEIASDDGCGDFREYVDSAIVDSIVHTLDVFEWTPCRNRIFYEMPNGSEGFRSAVHRIIGMNGRDLVIRARRRAFGDEGSGPGNLPGLPDEDENCGIRREHAAWIRSFLVCLGLFVPASWHGILLDSDGRVSVQEKEVHLLSQPGMRRSQVGKLAGEMADEARPAGEGAPAGQADPDPAGFVRGPMLEEIVLVEILAAIRRQGAAGRFRAFPLEVARRNRDGRIRPDAVWSGMAVTDQMRGLCLLVEIGQDWTHRPEQAERMNDPGLRDAVKSCLAPGVARIVLHRGDDRRDGDVPRCSVETFLRDIHRDFRAAMNALIPAPPPDTGIPPGLVDNPMSLWEISPHRQTPAIVRAVLTACRENAERRVNPEEILPFIRQDLRDIAQDFMGRWMERLEPQGPGLPPRSSHIFVGRALQDFEAC